VLALTEFCGPVRFRDFDPKRPGGCIGKSVDMPLVQIAATAESQTANTMRMVRAFAPKDQSSSSLRARPREDALLQESLRAPRSHYVVGDRS